MQEVVLCLVFKDIQKSLGVREINYCPFLCCGMFLYCFRAKIFLTNVINLCQISTLQRPRNEYLQEPIGLLILFSSLLVPIPLFVLMFPCFNCFVYKILILMRFCMHDSWNRRDGRENAFFLFSLSTKSEICLHS